MPVTTIRWGSGPLLLKIGILEIRGVLLGGAVIPAGPLLTKSKLKGILIALGGVGAQWLGVWIIGVTGLYKVPVMETFCQFYMIFAFMGLTQLLPIKKRDGFYIFQSIRGKNT